MKQKYHIHLLILLLLCLALPGYAQDTIKIAAGSSSKTYEKFLAEIITVAVDPDGKPIFKFEPNESAHGAIDNLDALVTNKVDMAFMHSDVPFFRAQRDDLSKFKTLVALFPEEVHVLAPRVSKRPATVTGRTFGFGGTSTPAKELRSVEDLAGMKVGAAGGGAITSQVIKMTAGINYEFTNYDSGDAVIAALDSGAIDAAIFVGAAPLPNIEKLGSSYKLLPFGSNTVQALSRIYAPANITYTKMSPTTIPTVSADCLLMSKEYKSPKNIQRMALFRKTLAENLISLQENSGYHASWSKVNFENHGKWPYLELPAITAGK